MNPTTGDASQPLSLQPAPPSQSSPPRATARLQLHADFTLIDARRQVPYYAELGISHLYVSPIFPACPGSQHRYDVLDFTLVSPVLGGEAALRELTETLRAHGMGLIIDIVPNHMAASYVHNPWWRDVLAHGRKSRYADFFDIDWQVPDPALCGKLLLPILGQPYGEALKAGELTLAFEPESCNFELCYFDSRLPLALPSYGDILRADPGHRFDTIATRCKAGDDSDAAAQAVQDALRTLLRDEEGAASLVQAHDPRTADGLVRLHSLLQRQHYRLAWWRTAADEINWRRFFEISELVGLRVERPEVFEATHALVFRLYREGLIDGVRADHVDGLVDPAAYCRTLRSRLTALTAQRPEGLRTSQLHSSPYFVVEKILAKDEALRTSWAVDGTTGYDFMNEVSAVLHDGAGAPSLDATWSIVSAEPADFAHYELAARRQILSENLCSERDTVVRYLHELARLDMSTQDLTRTMIQRALEALLHYFPVYRTYFRRGAAEAADNAILQAAVDAAQHTLRAADHPILMRLQAWLGSEQQSDPIAENLRQRALARFQQLTSPLAAKSVEDTAFYRYGRLLSRNEVGSKPDEFALSPQAFHERIAARSRDFPRAMLATATHDHKRGPDARARLAVLSELASQWREVILDWIEQAQRLGPHPDTIDQSMLYQTLIGAWPLDLPAPATREQRGSPALHTLIERVEAWQLKSLREAKRRSNWIAPDLAYEKACSDFLHALERDFARPDSLLASVGRFAHRLATAGALNSLTQTALHLSTPGVPDIYQGSESWDFSLVDPDNRRPVDFEKLLADLRDAPSWPEVLLNWQDGRIKQKLVHALLALRRAHPALFALGSYTPLACEGPAHAHVIGHARQYQAQTLMVIASRLSMSTPGTDVTQGARPVPLIAPALWQDTALIVPIVPPVIAPTRPALESAGDWINVLTGEPVAQRAGRIYVSDVLATLPVAVLMRAR